MELAGCLVSVSGSPTFAGAGGGVTCADDELTGAGAFWSGSGVLAATVSGFFSGSIILSFIDFNTIDVQK